MPKTAIILGATGLTGGALLNLLLNDQGYEKVKVFGRSSTEIEHPKLEEHLIDMFALENSKDAFTADVVFCCIGTTKAKTPNKETYKKIDYGIPVSAAKLAKANDIKTFVVISALGADASSSVFYNKIKGEMERDVMAQGIKNTYIMQPSLIGGDRTEKRSGERLAQFFMGTFSFLVPKKYKIIEPKTIAKAMSVVVLAGFSEIRIESDKIKEIAQDTSK